MNQRLIFFWSQSTGHFRAVVQNHGKTVNLSACLPAVEAAAASFKNQGTKGR